MYAKIVKQLHVYAITFSKVFCAITNIKIAWINPWLIGYDIDMISLNEDIAGLYSGYGFKLELSATCIS